MANTFALTDSGVVLQQPAPPAPGPQITLQGGGGNALPFAQAGQAPGGEFAAGADMAVKAMDALNQMTQGALQPYIEKQQKKAYAEGMAKVAAGQALMEIEREQPWYTRIFGPSATVQGAQAMAVLTAMSQAQSEVFRAMPELRQQGPDAFRQFLVEQYTGIANTGDVMVDGIIQQKLAEEWPALIANHTKQHYAWQQEDAGNKFVAMQLANGGLLQAAWEQQAGYDAPPQQALEVEKFVTGLTRPAGMDAAAYGQYMALAAQSQLEAGNFAAYEAMKAAPGVWQTISPEARLKLENGERLAAEHAARDKPVLADFMTDHAKFSYTVERGAFAGTEPQLHTAIDHINAGFRERTGSSHDIIDNAQRGKLVQAYYKAQAGQASAWEKARMAALSDQEQQASVALALNTGDPSRLPPGVSEANLRTATEAYWRWGLDNPEHLDTVIGQLARTAGDPKLHVDSLKWQMRQDLYALMGTDGTTPASVTKRQPVTLALTQKFLAAGGGPGPLSHYVGADLAARAQVLVASGANLGSSEEVLAALQTIREGAGAHVTQTDMEAAEDTLVKQGRGWLRRVVTLNWGQGPGMLRELDMNEASVAWLAKEIAPEIARRAKANPGLSAEAAAKVVLAQRLQNADVLAGTIVRAAPNQPAAKSLIEAVREMSAQPVDHLGEDYQTAVRDRLHQHLKEAVTRHAGGIAGAKATRFAPDAYEAVSGVQLGGGQVMVTFQHKESRQPFVVQLGPDEVLEQLARSRIPKPYQSPLPPGTYSVKSF